MSSMISFILEKGQKKSLKEELEFHNDGINAKGIAYIDINNTEYGIDISVNFEGEVYLICSRCAVNYTKNEVINHQIIIAKTDEGLELDDETAEMNVVSLSQSTLDVYELLRQLLIEKQEMRPLCKENCKGLCPTCGTNLNHGECDCEVEDVDPRWAKLKSLDISKEEV
ncbi:MAG: YceD family protein [Clostridia bacterium]